MTNLMHKFLIVYYNPLHVHVSSNILLILRTSNCINTASGIVTLSKWPYGAQVEKELWKSSFSTYAPYGHLLRVTIPDAVLTLNLLAPTTVGARINP